MQSENKKALEEVREVLARRKRELIDRFNAEGAAIGKADPKDSSYVITIYIADPSSIPDGSFEVEGIPLKFVVSGRFRAQE